MSGGFQDKDYGTDYGINYARYSDIPDYVADGRLKARIETLISDHYPETLEQLEMSVRNGFVFIRTWNRRFTSRDELKNMILGMRGVRDVILQILN